MRGWGTWWSTQPEALSFPPSCPPPRAAGVLGSGYRVPATQDHIQPMAHAWLSSGTHQQRGTGAWEGAHTHTPVCTHVHTRVHTFSDTRVPAHTHSPQAPPSMTTCTPLPPLPARSLHGSGDSPQARSPGWPAWVALPRAAVKCHRVPGPGVGGQPRGRVTVPRPDVACPRCPGLL